MDDIMNWVTELESLAFDGLKDITTLLEQLLET